MLAYLTSIGILLLLLGPKEVQQLAADFLHDPYQVHVGSLELRANTNIKQIVEVVQDFEKYPRLIEHLKTHNDGGRILIFVETKKGCDQLTRSLRGQGLPVRIALQIENQFY